jgi:hypothetical protein
LGQPLQEVWSEIMDILRPLIDAPFNGGPATWVDDIPLEINRFGFVEETHFTIAYSPVPDDTAPRGIGGVLATVHEITEKIIGERRITALRDLGARAGEGRTAEEACALAATALMTHEKDIPFALIYLLDTDGATARLAATSGAFNGQLARLGTVALTDDAAWPFAQARETKSPVMVAPLAARLSPVPLGSWSDPPHTAWYCRSAPAARSSPGSWSRASVRGCSSAISTTASSTWWRRRFPLGSRARAPTRKNASAPRRWRRSIAPRRYSSQMSATNSAHHSA